MIFVIPAPRAGRLILSCMYSFTLKISLVMTRSLLALLLSLAPALTFAHDGHGFFYGHELAHYLTSPAHVIPVAIAVAITAVLLFRRYKRAQEAR